MSLALTGNIFWNHLKGALPNRSANWMSGTWTDHLMVNGLKNSVSCNVSYITSVTFGWSDNKLYRAVQQGHISGVFSGLFSGVFSGLFPLVASFKCYILCQCVAENFFFQLRNRGLNFMYHTSTVPFCNLGFPSLWKGWRSPKNNSNTVSSNRPKCRVHYKLKQAHSFCLSYAPNKELIKKFVTKFCQNCMQ